MAELTQSEIMKIVNRYIGVTGGYLGDFSYRTHAEFYPEYCGLDDIDPDKIEGTTRGRFVYIINSAQPRDQAKIIRGVVERFPCAAPNAPATRTDTLRNEILEIAARLETIGPVLSPKLEITSEVVERAIIDSENLLKTTGAVSGVDRIHTTLHGYLLAVCDKAGIKYPDDASLTAVFKLIRQQHPKLHNLGHRSTDIERIINSSNAILDALNPVRNKASVAHPNKLLLEPAEAMLVINIVRSLLHYLNEKLKL